MKPGIVMRQVARGPLVDQHLAAAARLDGHQGADGSGGPPAPPHQRHAEPVITIATVVPEQRHRAHEIDVRDDHVQVAVVVVVPHRRTTPRSLLPEVG